MPFSGLGSWNKSSFPRNRSLPLVSDPLVGSESVAVCSLHSKGTPNGGVVASLKKQSNGKCVFEGK